MIEENTSANCHGKPFAMTHQEMNTTGVFPLLLNQCEQVTKMPRFTIWRECFLVEKILDSLVRRMMIFASEDVGIADSQALLLATSAINATEKIGMPEVRIILMLRHILPVLPKIIRTYLAINDALEEVSKSGNLPIPLHLRNATTTFFENYWLWKRPQIPT